MTLQEHIKALAELEHQRRHVAEVATGLYGGRMSEDIAGLDRLSRQAASLAQGIPLTALPIGDGREPLLIRLTTDVKEPVRRKDKT